jgi:hypothetical protein
MMRVHIVYASPQADSILGRLSRDLAKGTGWTLSRTPEKDAINYWTSFVLLCQHVAKQHIDKRSLEPYATWFFHPVRRTTQDAMRWGGLQQRAALRVITAPQYELELQRYGPTALVTPPLDREKFQIVERRRIEKPVAGVSGLVYSSGRKGEGLLVQLTKTATGRSFDWRASGRDWPIQTTWYEWPDLQKFYHSIDVLVCTSIIEGVPFPPLEALACGIPIVIPRHVGLLDTLPDLPGIRRFTVGDIRSLELALSQVELNPNREELRAVTERFTSAAWAEGHLRAFEELHL